MRGTAEIMERFHSATVPELCQHPYPLGRLGLVSGRKADSPSYCKHKWSQIEWSPWKSFRSLGRRCAGAEHCVEWRNQAGALILRSNSWIRAITSSNSGAAPMIIPVIRS